LLRGSKAFAQNPPRVGRRPLLVTLGWIVFVVGFAWWVSTIYGFQLRDQLRRWQFWVLEAQFVLLGESRNKSILSLNSLGRVREYLLTYTMSFTVRDAQGAELVPPTQISLRRNMAFDETQVLAKESEEALLYRDMQADIVQQIIRRLAAMKPAT